MEEKRKYRIALSIIFFLSGLSFSTLASRIPTIKAFFDLNEAELGSLLLVMPISSIIGLPISGWLVANYDTKRPMVWGAVMISLFIMLAPLAPDVVWFGVALFMFAFFNRILNIAMNTQAITLQDRYGRKINGSFHGLWSVGGIVGVGLSTVMVSLDLSMQLHFIIACSTVLVTILAIHKWILKGDRSTEKNKVRLGRPDPHILALGVLVFLAAISEGGMFDWSGVYFKEVVGAEVFTLGYLIFMIAMASSRFVSDHMIEKYGLKRMYLVSSLTSVTGYTISVLFPTFWMAMIGFTLVGFGTASIFPMTFSLAGTSRKYSTGMAISLIATYGMIGVLAGPPMIGYIAHLLSLKASFVFLGFAALMIIPVSRLFFNLDKKSKP